jgi:hypothetical protein
MNTVPAYSGKLTKFYRQPKVYISLPSGGNYYPQGSIDGDVTNLPVFGMTAMDEIMFKTPDALFSGESVVAVIKSCIPAIKDPWQCPQIDLDTILIAIRMATYGDTLNVGITCESCKEEWEMDIDLGGLLAYFQQIQFDNTITIDPLTFHLRPMTYKEQSDLQMKAYGIQKQLADFIRTLENDPSERKTADKFYKQLGSIAAEGMRKQIEAISADEDTVSNQQEITDWLNNSEKMFYDGLKEHIERLREVWTIPKQKTSCPGCNHEQETKLDLDNSNFFAKS